MYNLVRIAFLSPRPSASIKRKKKKKAFIRFSRDLRFLVFFFIQYISKAMNIFYIPCARVKRSTVLVGNPIVLLVDDWWFIRLIDWFDSFIRWLFILHSFLDWPYSTCMFNVVPFRNYSTYCYSSQCYTVIEDLFSVRYWHTVKRKESPFHF